MAYRDRGQKSGYSFDGLLESQGLTGSEAETLFLYVLKQSRIVVDSMDQDGIEANRLVADFMTASAPLEAYLQQGQPLTPLQLQSITNTIDGLQTFLDVWHKKHG